MLMKDFKIAQKQLSNTGTDPCIYPSLILHLLLGNLVSFKIRDHITNVGGPTSKVTVEHNKNKIEKQSQSLIEKLDHVMSLTSSFMMNWSDNDHFSCNNYDPL